MIVCGANNGCTIGKSTLAVDLRRLGLVVLMAIAVPAISLAADWPMYRHDRERSGVTAEQVDPPLSQHWVYRPRYAPEPLGAIRIRGRSADGTV